MFVFIIVFLPSQYPTKNERGENRGIAFNNIFRSMNIQLTPGDLFVWHGSRIRTIGSGRIRYLAKITPERNVMPLEILVHHRHHADWKIACNSSSDLKKSHALSAGILPVPFR